MNISAAELKHALKKLSPVKTETYRFDVDGVFAQDSDVIVVVDGPKFGGTFNTNGKKLTQVVNRMSGQIEITQAGNKLTLKSAKALVELEIQPTKSIPNPPDSKYNLTLDAVQFKRALSIASASASPAKSAAFGGVVLFQNLPLGLEQDVAPGYRVTGTDAVVLTTVTVDEPVNLQFRSLINLTAASIVQIMDGDKVTIGDTDKYLVLQSGSTTVYASKPVQKYPDFDGLLAKPTTTQLSLKPTEWLSALRTVEPLIEDTDQGAVAVHFDSGVVYFKNVGVGSTASDESPYEQLDPDPVFEPQEFTLKLQAKYLQGFLSRAGAEATFGVTENPVRLESDNVVVLTMPVREKK